MIGRYITIKGNEYKLKMPFNNMVELMEKNPQLAEGLNNGELSIGAIRLILYYQLKHRDNNLKKFKLEDAGYLIDDYIEDGGTLDELVELITTVQMESMGATETDLEKAEAKLGEMKGEK